MFERLYEQAIVLRHKLQEKKHRIAKEEVRRGCLDQKGVSPRFLRHKQQEKRQFIAMEEVRQSV